jgi:hypothetical protein
MSQSLLPKAQSLSGAESAHLRKAGARKKTRSTSEDVLWYYFRGRFDSCGRRDRNGL